MASMTPEQRTILRLWLTIEEMQHEGQRKDDPVPTWRLTEEDGDVIQAALDADGRGLTVRAV